MIQSPLGYSAPLSMVEELYFKGSFLAGMLDGFHGTRERVSLG